MPSYMTHELHRTSPHHLRRLALGAGLLLLSTAKAEAQPSYSIDFQGPTRGMADSSLSLPITGADLLTPGTGTPAMIMPFTTLGLVTTGAGYVELDALSYGADALVPQLGGPSILFSVDEFASGAGGPLPPNVTSEGANGGNLEASADIFSRLGLPPLPVGPGPVAGNTAIYDGNGFIPAFGPAPPLTLVEPNGPSPGFVPDAGDNLDALGCRPPSLNKVYFSLDASYADPIEALPVNTGTAVANGFAPGDILLARPGVPPVVWAGHAALGLGPQDDLDALILHENGDGVFTPSITLFDWMSGATDMVLFSVRRFSPIIGTRDAIFGRRIEEGDVLTVTPTGPGILIAAEVLGLHTLRTHGPSLHFFGDEMDALSVPPCF